MPERAAVVMVDHRTCSSPAMNDDWDAVRGKIDEMIAEPSPATHAILTSLETEEICVSDSLGAKNSAPDIQE